MKLSQKGKEQVLLLAALGLFTLLMLLDKWFSK